jgi:chemotaxis protein methyltransferase CheR
MTRRLSDADFASVRTYLEHTAGLVFEESRRGALAAVVTERLTATGSGGVLSYLALLDAVDGLAERQRLLDLVTIQETHFHRNRPQIEALRRHVLPGLIQRAAAQDRPLNIWSAGCSTGEEPYTLVMVALEVAQSLGLRVAIRVIASDVSASALEVARQATYSGRTVELAEPAAIDRWLLPDGEGSYVVRDEVRSLVDFRLHNLVTQAPLLGAGEADLLVCRNVTIYFSRETTRGLVRRFHDVLRDGGWLVLGHSETLWQVSDSFELVPVGEAFAYRKNSPAPVPQAFVARTSGREGDPRRPGKRISLKAPLHLRRASIPSAVKQSAVVPPLEGRHFTPRVDQGRPIEFLPGQLLEQARRAMVEGRYAEAAAIAEGAATASPLTIDAYVLRGQALSNLGEDLLALDPLRKAVYLDHAAGHAHFLLAGALARTGNGDAAARSYAAAAATLSEAPVAALELLLDGRPVEELVALCLRLAGDVSGMARR